LRNLFWDETNKRWRTDEEVRQILQQHPERVPITILTSEAKVLSYLQEIESNAERYRIDPALIAAIISKESSGDYTALGTIGEVGLMQIRLSTARFLGYGGDSTGLYNPSTNVRYGTMYLRWQADKYSGRADVMQFAIAGYNAGTPEIKRGKFRNQDYVDSVNLRWERFSLLVSRARGIY